MGEWSANRQVRATAVWDKLLGFFGDSLLRKFGPEPPPEWVEAIDDVSDFQVTRGFKRLYSWKGGVPNLPDFMRVCRTIGDEFDSGPKPIALPKPEEQKFDGWDISANMRFFKYTSHRLMEHRGCWGKAGSATLEEATRIAVSYKNAWAQDMREAFMVSESTGELTPPPEEFQASTWFECMRRAEADISVMIAGKAA